MLTVVSQTWALLLGVGLLMICNGMLGTVLGVRAGIEAFSTTVTGLILTGYFVGFFAGSILTPRMIARVGHVRVFAALASISSAATLVHAYWVDPAVWFAMRVVVGFCYSGLYATAESWLNEATTNDNRGQLLSIYMIVQFGGIAAGQAMLSVIDPATALAFVFISILLSIGMLPLLLSATRQPSFESVRPIGLKELYRASPLGFLGAIVMGTIMASYYMMVPVWGVQVGLSVDQIALTMTVAYLTVCACQFPIGRLADRYDRRAIMVLTMTASCLLAAATALFGEDRFWLMVALVALTGGTMMPLYALILAHVNDYVAPEKMVSAGGTLVLLFGIGAIAGPLLSAQVMERAGSAAFFWWLAALAAGFVAFVLWRMARRAALPVGEQTTYVPFTQSATPYTVSLTTDWEDQDQFAFDFHDTTEDATSPETG